ncbi:MAG: carbohydrate kinase, partial [Budvicia sp.]|nr:carbohydrate kinase [Budvicia sp.]
DISGLPVELPQIEETGCLGAAMAAMVGGGVYTDFASAQQRLEHPSSRIMPDSSVQAAYQHKFQRYQFLVEALGSYQTRCESHFPQRSC